MNLEIENQDRPALDCWFLTGPTASGKTQVGLELASLLGAEIISLDSMTVYRGMNIGTAKPKAKDLATVSHQLIDIIEPNKTFSVSDYVALAEGKIAEIRDHGREVLFVGGTPLYLKALLRGMFDGPPADWEFRQQVEKEIQTVGIEALHQRLEQVDPLAADKLHPNDKRRIIRALEVYKLTGQPISHLQTQFDEDNPTESCKVFVLRWPREVLHERINDRVEQMFAAGFVDEVRGLRERYGELSQTASQAVGYREVIEHLHGERNLEETIGAVKTRTRAFARRQETWFRSLGECRPVQLSDELHAKAVAERIVAEAASSRR